MMVMRSYRRHREHGISLIMSLVLLVIIALVAVASIRGTLLEERMAGNLYDREIAFQSAESALRQAEKALGNNTIVGPFTDANKAQGLYPTPDPSANNYVEVWNKTDTTWAAASQLRTDTLSSGAPEYIVEDMGIWPDPPGCDQGSTIPITCLRRVYRVTAHSAPLEGRAQVILQTSFRP
ncbi:MAG TPA: PilX N-terminal domain-containing pilus assembly protein [Burkholderiaceae bacterium]|nr:PilX N-terminal domain-containing pilus assembly protein [Burkholderiaceae bacterium]